tara:strand:+ start:289 stop:507 length:219 start_codon:yes stop_codon:yes gene_type:complete
MASEYSKAKQDKRQLRSSKTIIGALNGKIAKIKNHVSLVCNIFTLLDNRIGDSLWNLLTIASSSVCRMRNSH